jgi:hypothetical protein
MPLFLNTINGDGSGVTTLNGSEVATGTVPAPRLPVLVASGASHAAGIAPDPGATAGTTKFLREDATWAVPAGGGGGGTAYSANVGNGSSTDIVVTHGLGTQDLAVEVRQVASPYSAVEVAWDATSTSTITLHFTTAPTSAQYRVTVQAGGVSGTSGGINLGDAIGGSPTDGDILVVGTGGLLAQVATIPESQVTGLVADLAAKALDTAVVHLTGSETLTGKTLTTPIISAVAAPTAAPGQIYFDSARNSLGVGVGLSATPANAPLSAVLAVSTTTVTVNTNTTAAQNLMSFAVPAGLLNVAGKTLRVYGAGVLSVNTTATVTIAVKLGGVTLATWTSASITGAAGTANSPWNFEVVAATVATGTSGTLECHGILNLKPTTGAGTATAYIDIGTGPSAAVSLTTAQTLQITVTFSANGTGGNVNACTERLLHLELSN